MSTPPPSRRRVRLRVLELASARGLEASALAFASGLDIQVIWRMCANERVHQMTINQIARVAEVLGVPTRELLIDENQ